MQLPMAVNPPKMQRHQELGEEEVDRSDGRPERIVSACSRREM